MIEFEFHLNENGCENCSHSFKNGDFVHLFRADGLQCCPTCANTEAIERFDNDNIEHGMPFDTYIADNGIGRLVLNKESFCSLDDGYYRLDKLYETLVITAKLTVNGFEKAYSKGDDNSFFMIVDDCQAVLIFPRQMHCDQYDFAESSDRYKNEASDIRSCTGISDIGFICSSDMIVGIAASKRRKSNLKGVNQSNCFALDSLDLLLKDINTLIAEYARIPLEKKTAKQLKTFTPEEMLRYCERRIQGQGKELKKAVYLVYQYLKSVARCKPFSAINWILTGISGSGKTEFFRVIRDFFKLHDIPVPVVQIDLSNMTEAGFKGEEPMSIPQKIWDENPLTNGVGICFLDEADKKCVASYTSHGNNVNAAIQANLLALIEGKKVSDDDKPTFNSEMTMFIFMGAFQELRNNKKNAAKRKEAVRSIGFGADLDQPRITAEALPTGSQDELTLQEMIEFGLMEELAGRMVQVINFHSLSEKDMLKLIKYKVVEIAETLEIRIEITNRAANEFLSISYGDMGVRYPMNRIKELTQNKIAEVFFDKGFNHATDMVVIDSLNSARIRHMRTNENEAS